MKLRKPFVFNYYYRASTAAATAKPAPINSLPAPLPPPLLVVDGCTLSVLLWVLLEICDPDVCPAEVASEDVPVVSVVAVTEVMTVSELTRPVVVPDAVPDVAVADAEAEAELRMSEMALLIRPDGLSVQ